MFRRESDTKGIIFRDEPASGHLPKLPASRMWGRGTFLVHLFNPVGGPENKPSLGQYSQLQAFPGVRSQRWSTLGDLSRGNHIFSDTNFLIITQAWKWCQEDKFRTSRSNLTSVSILKTYLTTDLAWRAPFVVVTTPSCCSNTRMIWAVCWFGCRHVFAWKKRGRMRNNLGLVSSKLL